MSVAETESEQAAMSNSDEIVTMDFVQVQEWLPHRYPFLLVDRIIEMVSNKYVVGLKNITGNESCFVGHFPGKPVYPGVLLLETMAQVAAVLARYSERDKASGKLFYLVGADNVKWKKQVLPGDQLRIEMRSSKKRLPLWVMEGEITVDGKLVTSATLSAAAA
jgi:3-hydroxyacyl-[acyl-carrier-protein] dehydratase